MTDQTTTPVQLAQLKALGFTDAFVETPRRLIASISGPNKSGKTHVALTAPGPIFFFDIDLGTEGVIGKFQNLGKQILRYEVRIPKNLQQGIYQKVWTDLKDRLLVVWKMGIGTVVIDSGSEAYEIARLAHFGKLTQVMPHHYTQVNSEWMDFMRNAYSSPMNTILIHKWKEKYVNDKKTGEYEISGFSGNQYLMQINITAFREQFEDGKTAFGIQIDDCRQNPAVTGRVLRGQPVTDDGKMVIDPLVNFEMLLAMVHRR